MILSGSSERGTPRLWLERATEVFWGVIVLSSRRCAELSKEPEAVRNRSRTSVSLSDAMLLGQVLLGKKLHAGSGF